MELQLYFLKSTTCRRIHQDQLSHGKSYIQDLNRY